MSHVQKWREANPVLADAVRDDVLHKFGNFASLYVNDEIHVLRSKGVDEETLKLVMELMRELTFAYDNWTRCAMTQDDLLRDVASSVGQLTPGANEFFNILNSYRATHNIR